MMVSGRNGIMARMMRAGWWVAIGAVLLVALLTQPAGAAQDETVNAFVVWQGAGQAMRTGADETSFIATIGGTVYIMTDQGPVDAGQMICPAMLHINGKDRSQSATGSCAITARDGAQVFADLKCTGVFLVGCSGDFTLTGGTTHFAGITGGGRFTMRSNTRQITGATDKTVNATASGILFWPALHYKIP
jgi:hypothetical protein